jgi:hypothetical protein
MSAGLARSTSFMLGSATVMIGPQASLYDLRPDLHSLGLVKNFQISTEPTTVDLTQGMKNTLVYSALTGNRATAQCEVYEYTARNLTYGLGLDGSALVPFATEYPTNAVLTGNDGSPVVVATFITATNVVTDFPIGAWISIQDVNEPDKVHYGRLTATTTVTGSAPTITHTLTFTGFGLKTGNNFPAGSVIQRVNMVAVGSVLTQPFFAAKVVGILPERNEPVAILMPKVRIMRGFSLNFSTENFGNLPFQFQPYDLVPSDPFFSTFQSIGPAKLMTPT